MSKIELFYVTKSSHVAVFLWNRVHFRRGSPTGGIITICSKWLNQRILCNPLPYDIIQILCYYCFRGCGKTLQENSGIFGYSPEPGQEYGDRCEWRITATHGERIVLNITELDILKSDQCNTDYLEMYNVDQSTGQSSLVVKYCGGVSIISYDIQPVKKFNCAVKFR